MGYNLDNYAPVAERLAQASEHISMVVTEPPALLTDTFGYIRATVGLKDGRSATGTASFRLDLQGRSAQATNPIEDCETSAVGRALAFLGYASSKSVASREEVQEAERRASYTSAQPATRTQSEEKATNGNTPGKASEKQIKMIFALWHKGNFEGKPQDWIKDAYKCDINDLSSKDASIIIETLQKDVPAEGTLN